MEVEAPPPGELKRHAAAGSGSSAAVADGG
jgi:hypothetical protein